MHADLTALLVTALVAVMTATIGLVLLVRRDLAPAAGRAGAPAGHGRWFLGAALGIGVIAFTLKIVIMLVLANFPDRTVAPLIAGLADRAPNTDGDFGPNYDIEPFAFKPLPAVAPAPSGNPTTADKVALGERLFHDTALSRDRSVSCASCHDVESGVGTDRRPTAVGITGVPGKRNAPTVFNAAFQARLFWDGRAGSLEEQAAGPPLNPDEMGMPSFAAIEDRIIADPSYRRPFDHAFGPGAAITMERITQAIAAYERTLVTNDTPYDRFVSGDETAMTAAQRRGMALFQSIGCVNCHSGPNFSGAALVGPRNPYAPLMAHRSQPAQRFDLAADKGRAPMGAQDGIWRIPSLRNVALTGPYFHNGSVTELKDAIRVMATAQLNAEISDDPKARRGFQWSAERRAFTALDRVVLTSGDIDDLAAFLGALTSDRLAARRAAGSGG
jgi:cytochrome c peroxidase